ncbi:MAG: hypothetical protein AABY41_06425 [Nitrospirota bacterium]
MRDVNTLKGLNVLKTMHGAKRRSIPKIQSSTYLDLYMLNKEKDRLLKEDKRLCMRKDVIKRRLEEINLEINKLQEAEAAVNAGGNAGFSEGAVTQKNGVKKEWKRLSLNY